MNNIKLLDIIEFKITKKEISDRDFFVYSRIINTKNKRGCLEGIVVGLENFNNGLSIIAYHYDPNFDFYSIISLTENNIVSVKKETFGFRDNICSYCLNYKNNICSVDDINFCKKDSLIQYKKQYYLEDEIILGENPKYKYVVKGIYLERFLESINRFISVENSGKRVEITSPGEKNILIISNNNIQIDGDDISIDNFQRVIKYLVRETSFSNSKYLLNRKFYKVIYPDSILLIKKKSIEPIRNSIIDLCKVCIIQDCINCKYNEYKLFNKITK